MSKIETKSNKTGRVVNVESPACLEAEDFQALLECVGEDVMYRLTKAQLLISFRGMIRGKLEAGDVENSDFTYSDEDISNADYSDWVPEGRQVKSKEEKIADLAKSMDPEEVKAILAKLEG